MIILSYQLILQLIIIVIKIKKNITHTYTTGQPARPCLDRLVGYARQDKTDWWTQIFTPSCWIYDRLVHQACPFLPSLLGSWHWPKPWKIHNSRSLLVLGWQFSIFSIKRKILKSMSNFNSNMSTLIDNRKVDQTYSNIMFG